MTTKPFRLTNLERLSFRKLLHHFQLAMPNTYNEVASGTTNVKGFWVPRDHIVRPKLNHTSRDTNPPKFEELDLTMGGGLKVKGHFYQNIKEVPSVGWYECTLLTTTKTHTEATLSVIGVPEVASHVAKAAAARAALPPKVPNKKRVPNGDGANERGGQRRRIRRNSPVREYGPAPLLPIEDGIP